MARAAARQTITQESLLAFKPVGQVTLLNFTDCHAQLVPLYFREPSVNLGVGEASGLAPHLTGADFLKRFGIAAESAEAYALSSEDFAALAADYGRDALRYALLVPTSLPLISVVFCLAGARFVEGDLARAKQLDR